MRIERKVGTIGDLARYGYEVDVHCLRCRHATTLRSPDLLSRYGDITTQRLLERFVCRKCGARWPQVDCRISAPSRVKT